MANYVIIILYLLISRYVVYETSTRRLSYVVHSPRGSLAKVEPRQGYPQEDELHTKRQVTYIVDLTFTTVTVRLFGRR